MALVNVSVVIPTRGDVDMRPVVESLSMFDEVLVWDNSVREDLGVYGRYAMIEHARNDLILTQDDDVIVSDPQAIVDRWRDACSVAAQGLLYVDGIDEIAAGLHLVANMPQEFRHDGYKDSCLVGFGACFHRDTPARAFNRWTKGLQPDTEFESFNRTCDIVFTALTPRVLVDVPKTDLPYAHAPGRMWKQPGHVGERARMLDLVLKVRDA